jgi:hypothetical protein
MSQFPIRDTIEERLAELRAKFPPIVVPERSDQLDFEWSHFAQEIAAHEAAHALVAYVLGATVESISMGPGTFAFGGNPDYLGMVRIPDEATLADADRLAVNVAGEVEQAWYEHRTFDFRRADCRFDREHARATIERFYGRRIEEIELTPIFQSAVRKAEQILRKNSIAVGILILKLSRPPFQIDHEDLVDFFRRMNVA